MTVQLHPHRRRFQSTLPREERPSLYLLGAHLHNFNPRSHERSDSQQSELITMLRISIHAPTRGATYLSSWIMNQLNFNPRSHERSDNIYSSITNGVLISIHAPTRGATNALTLSGMKVRYFNPRSHERSDSNIAQKICLFLYNTDNKYIIR